MGVWGDTYGTGFLSPSTIEAIDAPQTTTPPTYTLWWAALTTATAWIGRRASDTNLICPSVVTIEEIA
jgi:hypothetical protein